MINTDNLRRLRAMLDVTEQTGYKAQLHHPTEPNTVDGIVDLDADALRVLIAHYALKQIDRTRPAWLDPEPFDMPAAPRRLPEDMRE